MATRKTNLKTRAPQNAQASHLIQRVATLAKFAYLVELEFETREVELTSSLLYDLTGAVLDRTSPESWVKAERSLDFALGYDYSNKTVFSLNDSIERFSPKGSTDTSSHLLEITGSVYGQYVVTNGRLVGLRLPERLANLIEGRLTLPSRRTFAESSSYLKPGQRNWLTLDGNRVNIRCLGVYDSGLFVTRLTVTDPSAII